MDTARSRRRRAGRRRRHHRHLPAVPGARGRLLGAAGRGRRRRRRHLVLEPLPGRAVRLRELHLRLPVLARSCSTSGSGRSTSPAQPETERYLNHVVDRFDLRRHMRFDARGHVGGVRRGVGHVDGDGRRRHASPGAVPRRRDRRAVGAVLPRRARAATTSAASSTTPAGGRPTPVDFAGKRVAVVGTVVERRAGGPGDRSTTSRRSPCTSAPPTGARRSTTRRSPPRSRRSCAPTSRRSARR